MKSPYEILSDHIGEDKAALYMNKLHKVKQNVFDDMKALIYASERKEIDLYVVLQTIEKLK